MLIGFAEAPYRRNGSLPRHLGATLENAAHPLISIMMGSTVTPVYMKGASSPPWSIRGLDGLFSDSTLPEAAHHERVRYPHDGFPPSSPVSVLFVYRPELHSVFTACCIFFLFAELSLAVFLASRRTIPGTHSKFPNTPHYIFLGIPPVEC